MSLAENLSLLYLIKTDIKQAIINKGQQVDNDFSSYSLAINNISGGASMPDYLILPGYGYYYASNNFSSVKSNVTSTVICHSKYDDGETGFVNNTTGSGGIIPVAILEYIDAIRVPLGTKSITFNALTNNTSNVSTIRFISWYKNSTGNAFTIKNTAIGSLKTTYLYRTITIEPQNQYYFYCVITNSSGETILNATFDWFNVKVDFTNEDESVSTIVIGNELTFNTSAPIEQPEPSAPEHPNNEIWYTSENNLVSHIDHADKLLKEDGTTDEITYHGYDDTLGMMVIRFESDLTKIGDLALNLGNFINLYLPSSIVACGNAPFDSCKSMTEIHVPKTFLFVDYCFYRCSVLNELYFDGTIEEYNSASKGNAWKDQTQLETIYCNDGVISLL